MGYGIGVELIDVGKSFHYKQLFSGINAVVKPGTCLAITGCNGSGKSTLLKLIAGLVRPTAGMVRTLDNGKVLSGEERAACMGMVSPEIVFYSAMTGVENVSFYVRSRGSACSAGDAEYWCRQFGLDSYRHNLVQTYSTGMRQRLKFAVAAAVRPRLWLMDEPSSNLDNEGKSLIRRTIAAALAENNTVIIATNEPWEAEYASQKILLS